MNTIEYYNKNAEEYFNKTVDAKMTEQYKLFLKYVKPNGKILDFGCGSGRDSLAFKQMGFEVYPIDGSEELCKLAAKYTNLNVRCMDFFDLNEKEFYDGIWACSSILHVQRSRYLELLKKMRDAIKMDGCMFISFADGYNEEVYKDDGRYFNDFNKDTFIDLAKKAGLSKVDFFTNESNVKAHNNVKWNSFILKRTINKR